jgi:hypothetical protein
MGRLVPVGDTGLLVTISHSTGYRQGILMSHYNVDRIEFSHEQRGRSSAEVTITSYGQCKQLAGDEVAKLMDPFSGYSIDELAKAIYDKMEERSS